MVYFMLRNLQKQPLLKNKMPTKTSSWIPVVDNNQQFDALRNKIIDISEVLEKMRFVH